MKLAVVGAGWAGIAAAVAATRDGHAVTLYESSRSLGGRARSLPTVLPDGSEVVLDNGQHILIGAYTATLRLMQQTGIDPASVLLRLPLTLRFPDGGGLALPEWPAPLDAAWGIVTAKGWSVRDKASMLMASLRWQRSRFTCAPETSVTQVCRGLTPRVMDELIEPLCVSALNTPASRGSGQVFLRVIRDSLFEAGHAPWGGSNLLIPRVDLGRVFPHAAVDWLQRHGAEVTIGKRVQRIAASARGWQVDDANFGAVVLACPPWEASRLLRESNVDATRWLQDCEALTHEAITTVYVTGGPRLPLPMLALRSSPGEPAQFVFDRSQLGGPPGLLAFVVSASEGERDALQAQVLAQGAALGWPGLQPLQTVVEKRATFACTPGVRRPSVRVADGLFACGDYIDGPYPATLEGAVRSGLAAAALLRAPSPGA